MKKSQAAKKLMEKLNSIYNYHSDEVVGKKMIDYLVNQMGMLPPQAEFKPSGERCLCTMRESCSGCGGFVNEWEPE